jgi:O-antigen/teichoic acid export membrane protein
MKDIENGSHDSAAGDDLFRTLLLKLRGDTLRYIPSAVIPAFLSIAAISIFTRLFDPLEFGRYAIVAAVTVIMASLLSGWIQQSVLRYLPRFSAERRLTEFVVKLFVLLVIVSGAVLFFFLFLFSFIEPYLGEFAPYYHAGLLVVFSEILFATLNVTYQAGLRSQRSALYKILGALMRLALALGFIFLVRRDVVGILLGAAIANLVLIVPMLKGLTILKNLKMAVQSFDGGFIRMLAGYGLPMVGWMLCGQVLALSDRLLIGAFRGSTEVGIYSANYNLVVMGFGLISTPLLTASYPLIMTAWEEGNRERITSVISQFSKYYVIAIVPVVTFIALFSREIVTILLGGEFREGYTIIPFVLGGVVVWGFSMIGHKGLEIQERTRMLLLLVSVSTIANVALNLIIIPAYGYRGAAVTTLISNSLYPILVYLVTKPAIPWVLPWKSILITLLAALLMGIFMWGVRAVIGGHVPAVLLLAIAGILGVALYGAALFMMKELQFR